MVLSVARVRVAIFAMPHLMTLYIVLSLQPRFPLAWSQQASIGGMGRDQMTSHWSPGREENCWSGMLHAQILLLHHTPPMQPAKQELWQPWALALAEERKKAKYQHLDASHTFILVAVETTGVFGALTRAFLKDLSHRIVRATGEERSYSYLTQRLSVAIQRGNAVSVVGTSGQLDTFEEFLG